MSPIVPAIIPTSFTHLKDTLRIVSPFAREVQVDIVDGKFVPFISWPYEEEGTIADIGELAKDFLLEVDLMLYEPEKVLKEYVDAGFRRVVVHLETTEKLDEIIAFRKNCDFKLGFSINNDTPFEKLTEVIAYADYVQLMGIAHIGSQGQPFDERVLDRVVTLRHQYPQLLISIDGSVNEDTVSRLAHAGANRCVSGSAILKQLDPLAAFENLSSLFSIAS